MIEPANADRVWGKTSRVPADVLDRFDIRSAAAEALGVSGLPVSAEPLFEATSLATVPCAGRRDLVRFGTDFGTSICVDPPNGEVLSVPEDAALRVRFVNSDVESFATFLLETCKTRPKFPDLGDDEIDAAIEVLEARLFTIDPPAFADPDTWWSVIFEQLRDGLL